MEKVKVDKNMKFNMLIKDVEKINPLFSKCKVYIMYSDLNRNNSFMSKESIEEAIPTLFNIPIIGEYLEDKDNFGGHGGRLEITDGDVKYIQTTVPYGLVPESANICWEDVTEKDGTVNEYLVADGCILWTGRYDQLNTIMEEGKFNQSMEIIVDSGEFAIIEGKEVFKIDKFIFSALCILGVDKGNNPDDHVEPAFESSSIITYNLDKDKFKLQFNQMLEELKYTMQKGGNDLTENTNEQLKTESKEEFEQQVEVETELESTNIENETKENFESEKPEDLETKVEEEFEKDESKTEVEVDEAQDSKDTNKVETETKVESDATQEFALTAVQLMEQLRMELNDKTFRNHYGDEVRKYWYVDHTDTNVIFENAEKDFQLYQAPYVTILDKVEVNTDMKEKVVVQYVPMQEPMDIEDTMFASKERFEFEKSSLEHELKQEYESLKVELEELRKFKRDSELNGLYSKFEGKLTKSELDNVFTNNTDKTISEIENLIFVEIGKKNFSLAQTEKQVKQPEIQISKTNNESSGGSYGDLIAKHLNN